MNQTCTKRAYRNDTPLKMNEQAQSPRKVMCLITNF